MTFATIRHGFREL